MKTLAAIAGLIAGVALTVTFTRRVGPWLWWLFTLDQR